jgi:hypothetical protein
MLNRTQEKIRGGGGGSVLSPYTTYLTVIPDLIKICTNNKLVVYTVII